MTPKFANAVRRFLLHKTADHGLLSRPVKCGAFAGRLRPAPPYALRLRLVHSTPRENKMKPRELQVMSLTNRR